MSHNRGRRVSVSMVASSVFSANSRSVRVTTFLEAVRSSGTLPRDRRPGDITLSLGQGPRGLEGNPRSYRRRRHRAPSLENVLLIYIYIYTNARTDVCKASLHPC